jgi:signal transduction histidine kinase/ActR/RegA family two-component response regulator
MLSETPAVEERVLILAPTPKDARISQSILAESGVASTACTTLDELCNEIEDGAGAIVLSEEALRRGGLSRLVEAVGQQPAWSDFPFLVLTGEGADSELALRTLETLGNVTLLERPVRVPALVSAVRAALRARRRQYQIRDHLAEARRIADTLREADRRKDEFLAILAHELRNPLAPLRNSLETMRLSGDEPGTTRLARGIMERQVDQMVRLIDDLLDVSRVSRGKITLTRETLELRAIIMDALEVCRPLVAASSHQLAVTLPEQPVRIEGDRTRLVQVMCNLISNAAKYTAPGGRIGIEATVEGADVVIAVSDNGVGIPADMLAKVFDLFMQVEGTLERSQGGLGIGLTLVKRLVELHGGTVEASSDGAWRGSRFVVRLPRVLRVAPILPAPSAAAGLRVRPHRILVADDNRDAADSLAAMLRLGGHEVSVAYDGREALALAESFRPEVALLDIGMPRMNGYETAHTLRQRQGSSLLTLFALTGWGQPDDKRRSRAAGFDHHFVKPLDPAEFERVLAERAWPLASDTTAQRGEAAL